MPNPDVLMVGAYPERDMAPLEISYTLRKLWLADDKDAFLERNARNVRAIATRDELGGLCPRQRFTRAASNRPARLKRARRWANSCATTSPLISPAVRC